MRRVPTICFALAGAIASPHVEADPPSDAERLYNTGQDAFDAERYDEAIAAWSRSFELSREPGLLFNLGQAYRRRDVAGDCVRARDHYQRFVALEPASPRRTDAVAWLEELRCPVATTPTPQPAPTVPPATIAVRRGSGMRVAGIASAAGGLLLMGTGVVYGNKASQLSDDVSAACATGCNWNDHAATHAAGERAERTQWVLYGVGAATVVTGAILYGLGSRERAPVVIAPTRGGAAISWSGSW